MLVWKREAVIEDRVRYREGTRGKGYEDTIMIMRNITARLSLYTTLGVSHSACTDQC